MNDPEVVKDNAPAVNGNIETAQQYVQPKLQAKPSHDIESMQALAGTVQQGQ